MMASGDWAGKQMATARKEEDELPEALAAGKLKSFEEPRRGKVLRSFLEEFAGEWNFNGERRRRERREQWCAAELGECKEEDDVEPHRPLIEEGVVGQKPLGRGGSLRGPPCGAMIHARNQDATGRLHGSGTAAKIRCGVINASAEVEGK
jgi:hypothetical protein